jgi:hypothetical protein
MKTETIQQFLDRGGKITKVPTRYTPAKRRKAQSSQDKISLESIPLHLKIALGIK